MDMEIPFNPQRAVALESARPMPKKDRARLQRLERENTYLRERLDRSMTVYREQLYEIVELRTKLDLVRAALGEQE